MSSVPKLEAVHPSCRHGPPLVHAPKYASHDRAAPFVSQPTHLAPDDNLDLVPPCFPRPLRRAHVGC